LEYDEKEYIHDLDKLKQRFAEQQILDVNNKLSNLNAGDINIQDAMRNMQSTIQNIKELHKVKSYERKTLKDAVPIFREEYNAKLENPNFDAGIKTGYSYLDFVTDGLRPGELLLVGGESGSGKS